MCTGIKLMTDENEVFWGRTQDFDQDFDYAGITIPRNWDYHSTFTPFRTKYAVMGIVWAEHDVEENPVVLDGMNEHGLCGGSFYFDHFYKYVPAAEVEASGKIGLRGEEVVTWILTNYKDLDEIKENLNKDIGVVSEAGPMMGKSVPQHAVFQDKSGRSIVVEPTRENGFDIYENKIGVFTNEPNFDWHVTNLKTHLERSTRRKYTYAMEEPIEPFEIDEFNTGLAGIPSGLSPDARFLRAAYHKLLSVDVTREDALHQLIHLLGAVTNPKGSLRLIKENKFVLPYTQYTSYYDVNKMTLYIRLYENTNLQKLEFNLQDVNHKEVQYYSFRKDEVIVDLLPQD
ncbi:linear amide C-N hydrolase [Sporosarcina pasteurii]|uniref:Choloylglycine hydrolase n=1 Tax=Sporosarcina pasteurii TaxID=1474 RepID=A0A380BDW8_SPOPA|nr:linear amide C-N hydrolase [Sporosarcina pasteurii]MDS9472612.1 linear amide C-N hydrolase [Sporosarcina pasteurii]QBQ06159.1 linear amide C-N hydrolase [Sporosarcina pasteurii]SUI99303.1 Choloylglycine hydrolase [Sporosarcina pasteurii]